jgi:hypothetical protein
MQDDEPIGPPPSDTGKEVAAGLARAGVSLIPLAGSPLAELVDLFLQPMIHRRRDRWLGHLASAVDELRANAVDARTLVDNDLVTTVIVNATAAAARTHEEEKLRALRNAVVNSALALGPDEHTQMMFVRIVDEFTALHLQLLAYLRDPAGWFAAHGIARVDSHMGSRSQLLEVAFAELRGRADFYRQLLNELGARGLCQPSMLSGMVSGHAMWDPATTPLGNAFLDFISRPTAS